MYTGTQLVHTDYLQYLTALTVGLGLDKPITFPPVAPHLPPRAASPEWEWLFKFTNVVTLTNCFKDRKTIPKRLTKLITGLDRSNDEKNKYKPEVM